MTVPAAAEAAATMGPSVGSVGRAARKAEAKSL